MKYGHEYYELFVESTKINSLRLSEDGAWRTNKHNKAGIAARIVNLSNNAHSAVHGIDSDNVSKVLNLSLQKTEVDQSNFDFDLLFSFYETSVSTAKKSISQPNSSGEVLRDRISELDSKLKSIHSGRVLTNWQYNQNSQEVDIITWSKRAQNYASDFRVRSSLILDFYWLDNTDNLHHIERNIGVASQFGTAQWEKFEHYVDAIIQSAKDKPRFIVPNSGNYPIVFDAQCSGLLFHEAFGHPCEDIGEFCATTDIKDRIGQSLGTTILSIADDPTKAMLFGSQNIDDCGRHCIPIQLLSSGVLVTTLQDYSEGATSFNNYGGSLRRQDYRYPPMIRMTNTVVESGNSTKGSIIKDVSHGICVTKIIEGFIDTDLDSFSLYAVEARLIENGELTTNLSPFLITGTVSSFLGRVRDLADDPIPLASYCNRLGIVVPVGMSAPTCLVDSLKVTNISNAEQQSLLSRQ